ncbi:MAG TPA: cytochrome c [Nitrospira sp.]|nr:cytochrome c [Nitrospira sp.]
MTSFGGVAEKGFAWAGISMVICLAVGWWTPLIDVFGGGRSTRTTARAEGNAEAGRIVFNGKGVCYYCHGIDGRRDQLPQLEDGTAELIAQLHPQPTDLRNPKTLHLKTNKQRARIIREGHTGTGMFPDTRMTDQELADTLAYLATIRREGLFKSPSQ